MRFPTTARSTLAAVATGALAACGGSTAASRGASPPPVTAVSGSAGDTATFGARIVSIVDGPPRVTFETSRPAYVTLLTITDRAIVPIVPAISEQIVIRMGGSHTWGLLGPMAAAGDDRLARARGMASSDARLPDIAAFNRCVANARSADRRRREGQRPVVGRDSAGRPIYGPVPGIDVTQRDPESYCRMPVSQRPSLNAPRRIAAQPGRYLMLYLSDTPIAHQQILDLAITETDPKLMAISIARKLFPAGDAIWSAHYRPW